MYLYKNRIRGRSVNVQIPYTSKVSDEQIENLASRLRGGDNSVVEEIVKAHVQLIAKIAGQYQGNPDESFAIGLLAAVETCSHADQMYDNRITGFIVSRVHTALKQHQRQRIKQSVEKQVHADKVCTHPFGLVDVDECLEKSVMSTLEKGVLSLLRQGFTESESAKQLGVSQMTVNRAKANIEERFNAHQRCS